MLIDFVDLLSSDYGRSFLCSLFLGCAKCEPLYLTQGFQRRKRKARRFCVCEARRKPRGVEA